LMTIGLAGRLDLLEPLRQALAAVLATERQNRHDLLNLLGRNLRPPMAGMPQLPAGLALALGSATPRRSGFAQAIGRRRLGGIAGVFLKGRQLALQVDDPFLQLFHLLLLFGDLLVLIGESPPELLVFALQAVVFLGRRFAT